MPFMQFCYLLQIYNFFKYGKKREAHYKAGVAATVMVSHSP